ncbi:MAG TPA: excisionase family DNA-binding protein [Kineosporiaceae bacterium]
MIDTTVPVPLLTVPEARARLRVGNTTMFRLLGDGSIRSIKIGRRRLVPESALVEYVAQLEHARHLSSG